jgi:hypothetical protein
MDAEGAPSAVVLPNGSGAAALLAAGIGTFTLSVLAVATDRIALLQRAMIYYRPTGPLSGVTTSAIVVWLLAWFALDRRWRNRTVALRPISVAALTLLVLSVLLTFPPLADLFLRW